jgi:hypothetical protein
MLLHDRCALSSAGLYWFHFSAGVPNINALATDVRLNTYGRLPNPDVVNILRTSNGSPYTGSRTELSNLTAGVHTLSLSTAAPLASDALGVELSFSGFHLDSTMSPLVAFSVALSTSSGGGILAFDRILIDTHSAWQTNVYRIPVSGIWVVTLHVGDVSGDDGFTYLYIDFLRPVFVAHHSWGQLAVDMDTVTAIANLEVGAEVKAEARSSSVYSDSNLQTSMMGFLYSPVSQPGVAWCVYSSGGWRGPIDPVPFDTVVVNEGEGYNTSLHRFNAPRGGIYYIHMMGSNELDLPLRFELLLNGDMKAMLYIGYFSSSEGLSKARAIILRLAEGDELRVRMPEGHFMYGEYGGIINSFSGFLISP